MLDRILQLDKPLILFDLETTGVDTSTARIVSFAMQVYKPDAPMVQYKTLVDPGVFIPEGAVKTHGITSEIIGTGCATCWRPEAEHPTGTCSKFRPVPKFADLAPNLYRGFEGADYSGYNIFYDIKVMCAEFARVGVIFDYSKARIVDGLRLWQVAEPRTLSDFVRRFGKRDLDGAHDAMTDVVGTLDGLAGLFAEVETLPRTVQEIHDLCYPRDPNAVDSEGKFVFINDVPCFNFGKWKGHAMKTQPGYLQWMLGGDFSPEVKKIVDRALAGDFPRKSE